MLDMKELGILEFKKKLLYEVVGVSAQAVYKYVKRSAMQLKYYLELRILVIEYQRTHPGAGLRRVYDQLSPSGIGRDKFIAQMQQMGLGYERIKNPKKTTIPGFLRFPNLIKGMLVWRSNQIWQTDITYFEIGLKTYYIIFLIDVYSKYIKAYKVSETMHAYHNLVCLKQAIKANKDDIQGLIHHSDRGAQFTSIEYINELLENDIRISMASKGQDNAYAERINGTIKNEYLVYRDIKSFKQLKRWTKQAVVHYNTVRYHGNLPKSMTPSDFENKLLSLSYQERPKVIVYADGNKAIREDFVFLNSLTKKDRQDHVCPMKL